jgi:hypothetical protein
VVRGDGDEFVLLACDGVRGAQHCVDIIASSWHRHRAIIMSPSCLFNLIT